MHAHERKGNARAKNARATMHERAWEAGARRT